MLIVDRAALTLSVVSLLWTTYVWSRQGPRVRVVASFTHYFMGPERGGNHFALEVKAVNSGRGSTQIVGWALVSRRNVARRPKWYRRLDLPPQRWGIWHGSDDRVLPGSASLPMRLEGHEQATWTISLVDDTNSFPTLDQLIPDHEALVEMELAGRRRRTSSTWFHLPPREQRRSSHEIARDRGMTIAPAAEGLNHLADLLIDEPRDQLEPRSPS